MTQARHFLRHLRRGASNVSVGSGFGRPRRAAVGQLLPLSLPLQATFECLGLSASRLCTDVCFVASTVMAASHAARQRREFPADHLPSGESHPFTPSYKATLTRTVSFVRESI